MQSILIKVFKFIVFIVVVLVFILTGCINEKKKIDDNSEEMDRSIKAAFNVENFGANGDDNKDDTSSILSAIDAAKNVGGGTVFIDSGKYLVKSFIDVPNNVSIIGAGKSKTILVRKDGKSERVLSLHGDQLLQGLGFNSKIGILVVGNNVTVLNCKFKSTVQGIQNSISINNLSIINSIFDGCGYGILSNKQPSFNVRIFNSHFINNTADDIEINSPSRGWTIENSTFKNNKSQSSWSGFGVGVAVSAKDIKIKNSYFNNIKGQCVHVEDYSEVNITNSYFKNCGSNDYKGSPKADIAVLSNANVEVSNSIFAESDKSFSKLAIYNTDKPIGGDVKVSASKLYNKRVSIHVIKDNVKFLR
ncbi:glycosyl hydrolase family 28-related protein [Priestia megaterium]